MHGPTLSRSPSAPRFATTAAPRAPAAGVVYAPGPGYPAPRYAPGGYGPAAYARAGYPAFGYGPAGQIKVAVPRLPTFVPNNLGAVVPNNTVAAPPLGLAPETNGPYAFVTSDGTHGILLDTATGQVLLGAPEAASYAWDPVSEQLLDATHNPFTVTQYDASGAPSTVPVVLRNTALLAPGAPVAPPPLAAGCDPTGTAANDAAVVAWNTAHPQCPAAGYVMAPGFPSPGPVVVSSQPAAAYPAPPLSTPTGAYAPGVTPPVEMLAVLSGPGGTSIPPPPTTCASALAAFLAAQGSNAALVNPGFVGDPGVAPSLTAAGQAAFAAAYPTCAAAPSGPPALAAPAATGLFGMSLNETLAAALALALAAALAYYATQPAVAAAPVRSRASSASRSRSSASASRRAA